MRIAIIAAGSQGDVQPFAALGAGLLQAGHEVVFGSHEGFRELAARCRIEFSPLAGNPVDIVRGAEGQAWLDSSSSPARFFLRLASLARGLIEELSRDVLRVCRGCDAVVYSLPLSVVALSAAEALGIPGIPASLYPLHPTRAFPSIMTPDLRLPGANRPSASFIARSYWLLIRRLHDRWRKRELGLGPLPYFFAEFARAGVPYLYAYSPSVIPIPADWRARLSVRGYWFLARDAGWTPPRALTEFLEGGSAPLYVGFGSMARGEASPLTAAVIDAVRQSGRRAIVASGWGGLRTEALPAGLLAVDFVPHDWLFPRVAAAIHHGGAGTTAMALRSGVPSIVVPFFGDQFFWGRRVRTLGAGAEPIPVAKLTAESLTRAIDEVLGSERMRAAAAEIGSRIRTEDGVAETVRVLDGYLRSTTRRTIR